MSSRRRAGVVIALALALPLASAAAGCDAGTRSPEGAVRALIEAGASGDRDAVWRLVGPATRSRLEADAKRAAEGAGRRAGALPAAELLAVGWFPPRFRAAEVREIERAPSGDRAVVEVVGTRQERERITCVRTDGAWRVELP